MSYMVGIDGLLMSRHRRYLKKSPDIQDPLTDVDGGADKDGDADFG